MPHAVGVFVKDMHMNIRIAQPPMRTPKIDLKFHWHRNFQRDPKNQWLRELVASLFTDESDEWRMSSNNLTGPRSGTAGVLRPGYSSRNDHADAESCCRHRSGHPTPPG